MEVQTNIGKNITREILLKDNPSLIPAKELPYTYTIVKE